MRYIFFILMLTGCSSLSQMETVASKSYEIGCIDAGNNNAAYNYTCHQRAINFQKELRGEWIRQH